MLGNCCRSGELREKLGDKGKDERRVVPEPRKPQNERPGGIEKKKLPGGKALKGKRVRDRAEL